MHLLDIRMTVVSWNCLGWARLTRLGFGADPCTLPTLKLYELAEANLMTADCWHSLDWSGLRRDLDRRISILLLVASAGEVGCDDGCGHVGLPVASRDTGHETPLGRPWF